MTGHVVKSVTKREKVHTVTCECGASFDSIESEALARSYHSGHLRLIKNQGKS